MRKLIDEAIDITETSKDKTKFKCRLCDKGTPHILVVMGKDGDIHVHAPFDNKWLMYQLTEAITQEQKKLEDGNTKRD